MGRKATRTREFGNPIHYEKGKGYKVSTTTTLDGCKIRLSKQYFQTAVEARSWLEERLDLIREVSQRAKVVNPQWDDMAHNYMKTKEPTIAPSTYIAWEYSIKNHFLPILGGKTVIDAYSNESVMAFYEHLKRLSNGPASKNALVALYQGILEYAFNSTDLSEKAYKNGRFVVQRFKEDRSEVKEKRTFTDEEAFAFQNAWPKGTKEWVTIKAVFAIGARASEFLALTPADFDFQAGSVVINKQMKYVRGKYVAVKQLKTASSYRTVYFTKEIGAIISGYIADKGRRKDERVFRWTQTSFNRLFKRTAKLAGLDQDFSNHSARHYLDTYLSRFCTTDAERIAKAKMMGHNPSVDIDTYSSHHTGEKARALVQGKTSMKTKN